MTSKSQKTTNPKIQIPEREKWLYENKAALRSVRQGLKDAAAGRVKSLGSFAKYLDEDEK